MSVTEKVEKVRSGVKLAMAWRNVLASFALFRQESRKRLVSMGRIGLARPRDPSPVNPRKKQWNWNFDSW